jgi:hypothetical protein
MADPARRLPSDPPALGYCRLSPDVVLIPLEDGTAGLLDLDGSFFGLSELAAAMLIGTLDKNAPDTVERIAAEYNADVARVRADLSELLRTLRAKGLIRVSGDRSSARLRTVIAIAVSSPVLKTLGLVRNPWLKAPALLAVARLSFALAGWARTVDAWQKCLRRSHVAAVGSERERLIDMIDSATRSSASGLPSIACKERALCCWFMLHSAGIPARLVMGVQFVPFSGHCWCEVDDRILTDSPERCKAYTPVVHYDV